MNYFLFQLYKHDDPDCSELCECHMNEKLSCQVLTCIERVACNTGLLTSAIANILFFIFLQIVRCIKVEQPRVPEMRAR